MALFCYTVGCIALLTPPATPGRDGTTGEPAHPAFSVSPASGKMERRNGDPTTVIVTCDPRGAKGELKATLCFILPEEKMFSSYYGITCHAR